MPDIEIYHCPTHGAWSEDEGPSCPACSPDAPCINCEEYFDRSELSSATLCASCKENLGCDVEAQYIIKLENMVVERQEYINRLRVAMANVINAIADHASRTKQPVAMSIYKKLAEAGVVLAEEDSGGS